MKNGVYKGGTRFIDLTGQKFGRLTVVSLSLKDSKGTRWNCRCKCGRMTEVRMSNLKTGNVQSCGCLGRERQLLAATTHGGSYKIEYHSWAGLRDRCENPNNKDYPRYGGRGIKVCKRWLKFENFLDDLGDRPSPKHSIDRVDSNGNYCKENCRWATTKEQGNNRRNNVLLFYQGETKTVTEWSETVGIKMTTIHARLRRGWSVERALSVPPQIQNRIYKKKS